MIEIKVMEVVAAVANAMVATVVTMVAATVEMVVTAEIGGEGTFQLLQKLF